MTFNSPDDVKVNGVTFRTNPYYRFVLGEKKTIVDTGAFVTVDESWKGSADKFPLLFLGSKIAEISVGHPELSDKWVVSQKTPMLRGIFYVGSGFGDKGINAYSNQRQVVALGLMDTSVSDNGLVAVAEMRDIRWLRLSGTKISNQGLKHLSNLKKLEWLCLARTDTSGEGIKNLGDLSSIRYLSLSSRISAPGMSGVAFLSTARNLETLHAPGQIFNESELKGIGELSKITKLDFSFSSINNNGLEHIKNLRSIKELDISYSQVTDKSAQVLIKLLSLETLSVAGTSVSDSFSILIENLPRLKVINVAHTKISEKAKSRLAKKGIFVVG